MIMQSYIAINVKGNQITKQRKTLVTINKKLALQEIASWNKQLQPLDNFTLYIITEVKPLPYYNYASDKLWMVSPNVYILERQQAPQPKPFNGSIINTHLERLPKVPCNRTQLLIH